MSEIREPDPGFREAEVKRFLRHPQQIGSLFRNAANGHRDRRIPEEPVEQRAEVDRDDVALVQLAARGDAVDHLFVHRRADRRRISMVPLEGRLAATVTHARLGQRIEVRRSDAGRHYTLQLGEHIGHQRVGGPHALELRGRLADDHASARPARLMASAASMWARRSAVTLSGGCNPSIAAKVGRSR